MKSGFNVVSVVIFMTILLFAGLQLSKPVEAIPHDEVFAALKQGKPTIAEFGSDSCITCRQMQQVLSRLQQDYADQISVVHINIVKQPNYAKYYRIMLMPTQIIFDAQGQEVARHMGAWSEAELLKALGIKAKS